MKRLALTLLLLAPIALTGCQTIREHNPFRHREPPYKTAQQEQPLEVPPGLDQPPTADALTIPGATGAAPAGAQAEAGAPAMGAASGASGGSLTLSDTPDSAYRRVGLALARGEVGQVTAHDDTAHTYQVAVDTVTTQKPQGNFLKRMFRRSRTETVKGTVTVSVAPAGSGSVVSAQGNADAAARVMAVLQQRLGNG